MSLYELLRTDLTERTPEPIELDWDEIEEVTKRYPDEALTGALLAALADERG